MKKQLLATLLVVVCLSLFAGVLPSDARSYVIPVWYGFAPYLSPYYYTAHTVRSHPYYYRGYPYVTYGGPWYGYAYNRYIPSFNNPWLWTNSYWSAAATPSYWPYANGGTANGGMPGMVNTSSLNMRSEPGLGGRKGRDANVIGALRYGERVWINGRSGNWYLVSALDQGGAQGYVSVDHITPSANSTATNYPYWAHNGAWGYHYGYPHSAYGWAAAPYYRLAP